MTIKDFDELLERHVTLGNLIVAIHRRLEALEPIAQFIPVIAEEYAGRIAGPDSADKILAMTDEQRAKALDEYAKENADKIVAAETPTEDNANAGHASSNGG